MCEAIFRLFPCDKRVGPIKDYTVVDRGDVGVDGYGIFGDGKKGTVQCKYRQAHHKLTANEDHLTNFHICFHLCIMVLNRSQTDKN